MSQQTFKKMRNERVRVLIADLAYQLTHEKIGRQHTFAATLEKLTGFHLRTCESISKAIFEDR